MRWAVFIGGKSLAVGDTQRTLMLVIAPSGFVFADMMHCVCVCVCRCDIRRIATAARRIQPQLSTNRISCQRPSHWRPHCLALWRSVCLSVCLSPLRHGSQRSQGRSTCEALSVIDDVTLADIVDIRHPWRHFMHTDKIEIMGFREIC